MKQIGIQLHEKQIEAINNGATAFIMMVNKNQQGLCPPHSKQLKSFIEMFSPLQVGQKFFIQEEYCCVVCNSYQSMNHNIKCGICHHDNSESRENLTLTTATIEVKRVQELTIGDNRKITANTCFSLSDNDWLDSIYGQGTYESNPYVFIVTFEKDK